MYSEFLNQSVHLARFALSFILVFILWPRFLFPKNIQSSTDSLVARMMQMVLLLIALGYFLILTRLFELLSLLAILFLLAVYQHIVMKQAGNVKDLIDTVNILFFDFIDGIIHPRRLAKNWLRSLKKWWKFRFLQYFGSIGSITDSLLFSAIFLYSAYLRLYDAVKHAAPALSDAYTTLAWMKHIDKRELFYRDGGEVYPRGFHIILDVLYKFSAMEPLYVLRYAGPVVCALIGFSLYFSISRLSGRVFPGIIAALAFGVLGMYLPTEWERQASTNSQEFAFIFILPALVFFYRYLKEERKEDFLAGAAGLTVIGLVHHLALAYAGIGLGILLFAAFITHPRHYFKRLLFSCIAGAFSAVASLLPFGLGKLLDFPPHQSSVEYMYSTASIAFPSLSDLTVADKVGLAFLAVILIFFIVCRKKSSDKLAAKFILLLGVAAFSFYFYGAALSQSVMLKSRAGEFWALVIPCCIGMGWHGLGRLLPFKASWKWIERVICLLLVLGVLIILKPEPIQPYKIHSDQYIEQYLRISSQFRPKTWWIVTANQWDYGIIEGSGFMISAGDYLEVYDPQKPALTKYGESAADKTIPEDIFIFIDREIFKVDPANSIYPLMAPGYENREMLSVGLEEWVERYSGTRKDIPIFYDSEELRVYHLHIPRVKEEKFRELWGR